MKYWRKTIGFTLIEVLVAVAIGALMALMGWRGIDGMSKTRQTNERVASGISTIQAGLDQWTNDLNHMVALKNMNAFNWTGTVVRLTRLDTSDPAAGVFVVAWGVANYKGVNYWYRWQSTSSTGLSDWKRNWEDAARFDPQQGTPIIPIDSWNIDLNIKNSWKSLAQGSAYAQRKNVVPLGLRIALNIPQGQVFPGVITKVWASPTYAQEADASVNNSGQNQPPPNSNSGPTP
jgi:general secretion pathway protein J